MEGRQDQGNCDYDQSTLGCSTHWVGLFKKKKIEKKLLQPKIDMFFPLLINILVVVVY